MPRSTLPALPLRRSALAYAVLLTLMPAAYAQEVVASIDTPALDLAAIDQVTVVGSRARNRTVFDSAVPIDRFGPREVENALANGDLGAALQELAPSINFPRIESSGAADSVRGIQLRGLAPDQVLVLINGKRRHASSVLDTESSFAGIVPVDVNAIPPGAIDHIEILPDGAGAQYGSDAVAGVINIVLKKARSSGSASVKYGANHTDLEPTGERKIARSQSINLINSAEIIHGNLNGIDPRDI